MRTFALLAGFPLLLCRSSINLGTFLRPAWLFPVLFLDPGHCFTMVTRCRRFFLFATAVFSDSLDGVTPQPIVQSQVPPPIAGLSFYDKGC